MNPRAIRILFMKDIFLSRRFLFAYLAAGMVCSVLTCVPERTVSFVGFILVMTVAIASGIHMIGHLLLSESIDQTRTFIMSMPVSLLDYSIGKIAVVLTTYLIPWGTMLVSTVICSFVLPWANEGSVVVLPAIFLFLLAAFTLRLVTAVISESVGWTICIMVGCNVLLNVFLVKLFAIPEVKLISESDSLTWPTAVLQILTVEVLFIVALIVVAFAMQTRKRDLV